MIQDRYTAVVELVRHAHAGKRGQWTDGPDHERPLDDRGHKQAQLLVHELDGEPTIAAIVSSSFARCVMTVEPLAQHLGLDVQTDTALEELDGVPITEGGDPWVSTAWLGGRALGLLTRWLRSIPAPDSGQLSRLVLCSHGDVISALVATLAGRDQLSLTDVRCKKGGRYTLRFDQDRCVEATPFPPPDRNDPT